MGKIIVIDTETVTGTYGLLSVGTVVLERERLSTELASPGVSHGHLAVKEYLLKLDI
jgi:hypothetical protein